MSFFVVRLFNIFSPPKYFYIDIVINNAHN